MKEEEERREAAQATYTEVDENDAQQSQDTYDWQHLQSMFCGAFDSFATLSSKTPPAPAGIIEDNGILRNSALKLEEELLMYTSAGDSVTTLHQAFEFGVDRNPSAPCLGFRPTADSPYQWKSYETIQEESVSIGKFLKGFGVSSGDRVGLSGKNAPEYLTAIQGCFWAGATTVPIYDTFGEKECQYIIKQAEVKVVFVSRDNLVNVLTWTKHIPSLKRIVVWGTLDGNVVSASTIGNNDLVISFADCLQSDSSDMDPTIPSPPKPEDLAIIMYTSGTTGLPKGVMLPHSAILATIASMERYLVLVGGAVQSDDIFLSYLPLAHVFDFFCECFLLFKGAKIGYYRGDQKTLVDDIGELKPTIFVGVPRVFERIYKRVSEMVNEGSPIKKFLFDFFFQQKLSAIQKGAKFDEAHFLADKLVFHKIKERLGGRVRLICSGGAPLPQHLENWLKVTMCCPIIQGYGLTETCAASCVSMPDRPEQAGTVGPPLFSTECKLVPVPDLGYDGSPEGGGEICFRGPSVMKGYYQKPDATLEVLDEDGWFHTGDIGKIVNGGCVKIVDRKKQLFKLSQGEYVSPEKVEGIAAKSALVGQIWVYGTSTEAVLVAVIVPSEYAMTKYGGREKAIESKDFELAILDDLDRICRSEKLKGYEIPKGVIFHPDEWTPESDFVTPSFKLKRAALQKHFAHEIESLYKTLNNQ